MSLKCTHNQNSMKESKTKQNYRIKGNSKQISKFPEQMSKPKASIHQTNVKQL